MLHCFLSWILTLYFIYFVGDTCGRRSCVTLMPYILVTPHYPPVCRPILLLPTVLGRMLDKKLAGWQGFQLCEPGKKCVALLCAKIQPQRIHRKSNYTVDSDTFKCPDKSVWLDRSPVLLGIAYVSLPLVPIFSCNRSLFCCLSTQTISSGTVLNILWVCLLLWIRKEINLVNK